MAKKKKKETSTKMGRGKAKKPRRKVPRVSAIVTCDSVIQQMPDGKPSLIGMFDAIVVDSPSYSAKPFTVVTKLHSGKGTFNVGLTITPPGGAPQPLYVSELKAEQDNVYQGVAELKKLVLPEEGMYFLQVTLDGQPAGEPSPLHVSHAKKKEATEK